MLNKKELKFNLERCTKYELIEMLLIQWEGLGTVQEQIEEATNQAIERNNHTKAAGSI